MNKLHEEIIKEFEEEFDHYNPIHDTGEMIPVWNGADFQYFKSFLSSALTRVHNAVVEKCIKVVKCKKHKDQLCGGCKNCSLYQALAKLKELERGN